MVHLPPPLFILPQQDKTRVDRFVHVKCLSAKDCLGLEPQLHNG